MHTMDAQKIAARLRIFYGKSKLTLDQLAEVSGVGRSTAHNYLNGRTERPSDDTLSRLVTAMGYTMEDLYREDPLPDEPSADSGKLTDRLKEIGADVSRLAFESQMQVEMFAAALANAKEETRKQRIEKYVIFAVLVVVTAYAIYCFVNFDLHDPTKGIWQPNP